MGISDKKLLTRVAKIESQGTLATDSLWDAKGDLAVGTGAITINVAPKLTGAVVKTVTLSANPPISYEILIPSFLPIQFFC